MLDQPPLAAITAGAAVGSAAPFLLAAAAPLADGAAVLGGSVLFVATVLQRRCLPSAAACP